eukprot:374415-Rhodomonas_salina.1
MKRVAPEQHRKLAAFSRCLASSQLRQDAPGMQQHPARSSIIIWHHANAALGAAPCSAAISTQDMLVRMMLGWCSFVTRDPQPPSPVSSHSTLAAHPNRLI